MIVITVEGPGFQGGPGGGHRGPREGVIVGWDREISKKKTSKVIKRKKKKNEIKK